MSIVCPQVTRITKISPCIWSRAVYQHDSEEGLPVYEIQADIVAPSWSAQLEFGYVFDTSDPRRMEWVLGAHEDYGKRPYGVLRSMLSGFPPKMLQAPVTEAEIGMLLHASNDREARRGVKQLIENQHPGHVF